MPFYSPLRYPGGKNCLFGFFVSLIHENSFKDITYAEPYAGGAGLALRLLFGEYVNRVYINDYDLSIYSFWHSILEKNNDFYSWLRDVEISMDSWYYYKEVYSNYSSNDLFELGKAVFFLNRTNISGIIKGGVIGGKAQDGKFKMDARFKKEDLLRRISKIGRFKNRIILSNNDGLEFIKNSQMNSETLFYLDPPYYLKGSELYLNSFRERDHVALFEFIINADCNWIMSYDNDEFISGLYKDKSKITYNLSHSTSNSIGKEIVIFSDTLKFNNSIKLLRNAKYIEDRVTVCKDPLISIDL